MTTTQHDGRQTPAQLEATVDISATPAQVWALITDVSRMREWSPQVVRSFVLGGARAGGVRRGARFVNVNHRGLLHWPTNAKVVRFEPHSDFAFRIVENTAVWSFALEPVQVDGRGGTRLTQRRETPDGISAVSKAMTRVALGGQEPFTEDLRVGMQQTLARIKTTAETR